MTEKTTTDTLNRRNLLLASTSIAAVSALSSDGACSDGASAAVTAAGARVGRRKPNIIFIVSDDTGYGDLGLLRRRRGPRHADAQSSTGWRTRA